MSDGRTRRNIELKATDPDPPRTLAACIALGASDHGTLHQRDTYFAVAHGRLKLREQRPGGAQLIHYVRADRPRQRPSSYRLLEVDDPVAARQLLDAALGVGDVVDKRRRLLVWRGVRIHLDEVSGLGSFLELEAVAAADSDLEREHGLIDELRAALAIGDDRVLAHGYAQLLGGVGEPAIGGGAGREPGADAIVIRPGQADDLPAVAEIYNAGIAERVATFETEPRTPAQLAGWVADGRPFLVALREREVVGFARAGPYSDRPAYAGIGEHAVYVAAAARGAGLGRRLLEQLCTEAERHGLYKLTSRIFADNAPSRAAHLAAGFREVGVLRKHGRLDGGWKDCVLVERLLGDAAR